MDRRSVLDGLELRRGLRLSRRTWGAAAVLAGLRVAANDEIRAPDRDRGERKNQLADIWGVIGELTALRAVDLAWTGPVEHHPISFVRSVDEVDITVCTPDAPLLIEAKAHLLESGKSWFMINERAHLRSRRRGATGYVPVITAMGAGRAVVGPLITMSAVDQWGRPDKLLKDPALGVPLEQLLRDHFGLDPGNAAQLPRASEVASTSELAAWASSAGAQLSRWREELPELGRLHALELIDAIVDVSRRINAGH
jgi:hypothetical protein